MLWYWVKFDAGSAGGITWRGAFGNVEWARQIAKAEKQPFHSGGVSIWTTSNPASVDDLSSLHKIEDVT